MCERSHYKHNVDGDPTIFSKVMTSIDSAFCQEAIIDDMDSIMGNGTWVIEYLPPV